MRVENHTVGSIMHVVKRGAKGMEITTNFSDQIRFKRLLFYLNDAYQDINLSQNIKNLGTFERPTTWPAPSPLVKILAWTLMPNHFHLLLEEIHEGGIAKFMQRLCGSMSSYSNAKYKTRGSLFQGGYKGKVVDGDIYLKQVFCYIIVKNVFELYPKGLDYAIKNFDEVWQWALKYEFSSFGDIVLGKSSPILSDHELLEDILDSRSFKQQAKESLEIHQNFKNFE